MESFSVEHSKYFSFTVKSGMFGKGWWRKNKFSKKLKKKRKFEKKKKKKKKKKQLSFLLFFFGQVNVIKKFFSSN